MHCRTPILCLCLVVFRPAPFALRPSRCGMFRACRAVGALGSRFSLFLSCEQYLSLCCLLQAVLVHCVPHLMRHFAFMAQGSRKHCSCRVITIHFITHGSGASCFDPYCLTEELWLIWPYGGGIWKHVGECETSKAQRKLD